MTSLRLKIAHYPQPFIRAIGKLAGSNRLVHPRDVTNGKGRNLNNISMSESVRGSDLSTNEAVWFYTMLAPCTMGAVVQFTERGDVEKAVVGHFPTSDTHYEIPKMLQGYDPARSHLFMAGMSQRTSHETLRNSCEKLAQGLQDKGFIYSLDWKLEDRPVFLDLSESPRYISDLGLGAKASGTEGLRRFAYVGITQRDAIMLSLRYLGEDPLRPTHLTILARDQGIIHRI